MLTAYWIDKKADILDGWGQRGRNTTDWATRQIIDGFIAETWVLLLESPEEFKQTNPYYRNRSLDKAAISQTTREVVDIEDLIAGLSLRYRPSHRALTYLHSNSQKHPERVIVRIFKIPVLVPEKVNGLDQLAVIIREKGPILIPESWCKSNLGEEGCDQDAIDRGIALDFKTVPHSMTLATYDPARVARRVVARKSAVKRKKNTKYLLPAPWDVGKHASMLVTETTELMPELSVLYFLFVPTNRWEPSLESFQKLIVLYDRLAGKKKAYRKTDAWLGMMKVLERFEEGIEHRAVLMARRRDRAYEVRVCHEAVEFYRSEKLAWHRRVNKIQRENKERMKAAKEAKKKREAKEKRAVARRRKSKERAVEAA